MHAREREREKESERERVFLNQLSDHLIISVLRERARARVHARENERVRQR